MTEQDQFVRSSPFVDGYFIERTPETFFSDQPFNERVEQERFAEIVECIDLPHESRTRRYWNLREAPFTHIPSPAHARWWLSKLNVEAEDVAPLDADILAPLVAARDGVDAALTAPNQRACDYLARRPLLPLASSELRDSLRRANTTPLPGSLVVPAPRDVYLAEVASLVNPDFVRTAVMRGPDAEVAQRVRQFLEASPEQEYGWRWDSHWINFDGATLSLLLPSSKERNALWPAWASLYDFPFPPDISPVAAVIPEVLFSLIDWGCPSRLSTRNVVTVTLPMRTGPGAAAGWIDCLRTNGTEPALEWLSAHPMQVLSAQVAPNRALDAYLVLADFDTATLTAARNHGLPPVRDAVTEILSERSLPRIDDPGPWWHENISKKRRRKNLSGLGLEALPPLMVGEQALSPARIDELLQCLAASDLDEKGLASIREHVSLESCDVFAASMALLWIHRDTPAKAAWMLTESADLGGEHFAGILIDQMDQWWHEGQHGKALKGVQALGRSTSDIALNYLLDLVSSGPSQAARRREAMAQLTGIAQRRGLSINSLEDRLLVGVEKPPVKRQKARFLQAMVTGENWTYEDFQKYVIGHPALKEFTSGIVWSTHEAREASSVAKLTFRIDEEGRPVNLKNHVVDIEPEAIIKVAHPLLLNEQDRKAWTARLMDEELAPPFAQLSRPVFALERKEATSSALPGLPTKELAPKRLNGELMKHGWDRGRAGDGGYISALTLPVSTAAVTVVMILSGRGIHVMPSSDSTKVRIENIFLTPGALPTGTLTTEREEVHTLAKLPWSEAPPTVVSEALATLASL